MHFFDITSIIIITIFAVIGIKRGFINEIFRLAAVIAGFISAILFFRKAGSALTFITMPPSLKMAVSFILVYAATAIIVLSAGWIVRKLIHISLLGWLDRILGGFIGLLKATLLLFILTVCVSAVSSSRVKTVIHGSKTYEYLSAIPFPDISLTGRKDIHLLRNVFKESNPSESIKGVKQKLDNFRNKVDSVKSQNDSAKKGNPNYSGQ